MTLWLGLVQNEGKGCPKWGKREVRRQETGDRMGEKQQKTFCKTSVQNEADGCPEWGVRRQESGDRMGQKQSRHFARRVSKMEKERSQETGVRRQNGAEAVKTFCKTSVQNVQNGDAQLKIENTKHYVQRLSKVSE